MFEDPELQDPVSLSLTENYGDQNSLRHELKNAPSSPNYTCETPDIQVIIKEEEEGWTVSQNHENLVSEGESGHTSQHTCHPHIRLCREDGMRRQQASRCEESAGRSASATAAQQEDVLVDEKPPRLRYCGRVQEREATVEKAPPCAARETSRGPRGTTHFTDRVEPNPEGKQSTSSAEAGLYQRKRSARYHRPASSRAHKTASTNLDDQALHLTVRLHAGEEEEQDEEIGGLINSDGEVVEWDGGESSDQDSESTEVPRPSKGVVQSQSQRGSGGGGSSSPTLLMEVVSVGDEEEKEEAEDKERAATRPPATAAAAAAAVPPPPPLQRAEKRSRRKRRVVAVTEVSKELSDADQEEEEAPAKSRKRRSRRKISETQLYEAEPGISRRTRGKRAAESGKITPKSSPCAAAKRPYRKRKDVKPSPEGGESTAKKRPGRKMIHVPIEIPPELLKTPKEKVDYHCSVCGKEFPHAYKLERHQLIHTGEKPYCCSICGRGFNQKGNLKTHYKVHFGRKGSVDFDEEVNPLASELSSYLKSLPGESRIRSSLHCLECGKDCESQSALQAHHITTHAHGQPQADAAPAAAPAAVAEPRADAAGAEPPPDADEKRGTSELLFCRRCGIQFGDKDKLEEHMRNHVKEKPYSCPDCGKRFINESYIQIHQRLHTGEKPFLCSQCGRSFHTASSLKLHEMQHSGERPFACAICGKKFRINSYLMAHYQTHIKERPFTCGVCGKGYSRAEELKVHHRLHTGERPYECGECGKSFIYRQGLRQHQRTHAGKRIGPTRQLGRPKQQARLDI